MELQEDKSPDITIGWQSRKIFEMSQIFSEINRITKHSINLPLILFQSIPRSQHSENNYVKDSYLKKSFCKYYFKQKKIKRLLRRVLETCGVRNQTRGSSERKLKIETKENIYVYV